MKCKIIIRRRSFSNPGAGKAFLFSLFEQMAAEKRRGWCAKGAMEMERVDEVEPERGDYVYAAMSEIDKLVVDWTI